MANEHPASTMPTTFATDAEVAAAITAHNNAFHAQDIPQRPRRRNSVEAGRVSAADGLPNFIEAGAGLKATLRGAAVPAVFNFAAGYDQGRPVDNRVTIDEDLSNLWTLTANATNYLFLERQSDNTLVPLAYTVRPSDGMTLPATAALNQHHYVIPEGRMYVCTQASTGGGSSKVNAATTANAQSGGAQGGYPASNAYDTNGASGWRSSQLGTMVFDRAWIGQVFATRKRITEVEITQETASNNRITSCKVEVSDNNWATATTLGTFPLVGGYNKITIPSPSLGQSIRVKANASTGSSTPWIVFTVKFNEDVPIVGNPPVFATKERVCVGEAVTGATSVTGTTGYALNGEYATGRRALSPGVLNTIKHALGTTSAHLTLRGATAAGGALGPITYTSMDHLTLNLTPDGSVVEGEAIVTRGY
jgi:hypothetical protein